MARKVKAAVAPEGPKEKRLFVYLGAFCNSDGKLSHKYYVFEPNEDVGHLEGLGSAVHIDDTHVRVWAKPLASGRPGSVLEFMVTQEPSTEHSKMKLTVWTNTVRWDSMWHNENEVAEWQATHDAAKTTARVRNEQKKQKRRNIPLEKLEPFRKAYVKLDYSGRSALLARMIEYVTRGHL